MTQPVTTDDINVIYDFYARKFEQSKGKDAYFMLSKIEYALLQIRPMFDKTRPELQARFCQDLYQLLQMPNYCINCLKFIDNDDQQQTASRNNCPVCGASFCSGYCSSDLTSHPCETINKVRLRSMLFYPEITTIKLKTEELVNQSRQRYHQCEELYKEVSGVKIDVDDVDQILEESQKYLDFTLIPKYTRLYNSAEQTKHEQAEALQQNATDPFLYPYFIRICRLYSDSLTKLRANASYIEHSIVDIMQATKDLVQKQVRLFSGFNELLFILQQLDVQPSLGKLADLLESASAKHYQMLDLLVLRLEGQKIEFPASIKRMIDQLYMIVTRRIHAAIQKQAKMVVYSYIAYSAKIKAKQQQLLSNQTAQLAYGEGLANQGSLINSVQQKVADMLKTCMQLQACKNYGIFIDSSVQTLNYYLEELDVLKQQFRRYLSGIKFESSDSIEQPILAAKQDSSISALPGAANPVEQQANAATQKAPDKAKSYPKEGRFRQHMTVIAQQGLGESAKVSILRRDYKSASTPFGANAQKTLNEAQYEQAIPPNGGRTFTRRVVFLSDSGTDNKNVKAAVSLLEQQVRAASQQLSCYNSAKRCQSQVYLGSLGGVMQRSKSLRRTLETERQAQSKIMTIYSMRRYRNTASERRIILDTRLLRPFYRQFVSLCALENRNFRVKYWEILTMVALALDGEQSANLATNLRRVFNNIIFVHFCRKKRLWLGFNEICEKSSYQRMDLREKSVVLGSENLRRLGHLRKCLDRRVLVMPDAARKEIYQKLRGFVFDLRRFDDFEGILRADPR